MTFYRPEIKSVKEQKVTEKVTENQRQILEAIGKNSHITALELAGILGISERKTKENIKKLKEKALLRHIGPDQGGPWKIIGK
ncbi:MAG: winged helix-turn-helix transcriptional regulator [Elusimicrobia bacterium]|nr:winged helix-turn-helix transcriptional regulator [Elusimicrobiota bacterium]